MTAQEIVQAIKDGRGFVVTTSLTNRTVDVQEEVRRYTNMALAQLRGERDRLQRAVDAAHSAMHGSEYVGGPTEAEAWRKAYRAVGEVATQHIGQDASPRFEATREENTDG